MTPTPEQRARLRPELHPLIWPTTLEEADEFVDQLLAAAPERRDQLLAGHDQRNAMLAAEKADPLRHGLELEWWRDADAQLAREDVELQANFGANRSSKTHRAIKRLVEAAMAYPGGNLILLSETDKSSRLIQQPALWGFLRKHYEHLNWKDQRNAVHKIRYTEANGFTDGIVVLPNRTKIIVDVYGSDPGKYEGIEWGANVKEWKRTPDGRAVFNIGFVCDEAATLNWIEMLTRRARFRGAKGIWPFTPINGLTPAMKEVLGQIRVQAAHPASLLPEIEIKGCARGHVPYMADCGYTKAKAAAIWFHIEKNPLKHYVKAVMKQLDGADQGRIERFAYGWARDSVQRAFPKFGPWNIIPATALPEAGTNYMVTDPATARPFFTLWARVPPHEEGQAKLYIYRDWPDVRRFGEWAVSTTRETTDDTRKGWDGDRGPAQANLGFGYAAYKRLWLEEETVRASGPVERDPYRRKLQEQCGGGGGQCREEILDRIVDSRAAGTEHMRQTGSVTPLEELAEDSDGVEGMEFDVADGRNISNGITRINDLLDFNIEKPVVAFTNEPRLYVCEDAMNLIWAMSNYTNRSGEEGACKDPIDCLRYLVEKDLTYEQPGLLGSWRRGVDVRQRGNEIN